MDEPSAAELILAWANLGSLVEGTLKLFLSVYVDVYQGEIENLKKTNAVDNKKNAAKPAEGLGLDQLRRYFEQRALLNEVDLALVTRVQQRRNAIHAFKDRPIGDRQEFEQAVRGYLRMLRYIVARLPFPDKCYVPVEGG